MVEPPHPVEQPLRAVPRLGQLLSSLFPALDPLLSLPRALAEWSALTAAREVCGVFRAPGNSRLWVASDSECHVASAQAAEGEPVVVALEEFVQHLPDSLTGSDAEARIVALQDHEGLWGCVGLRHPDSAQTDAWLEQLAAVTVAVLRQLNETALGRQLEHAKLEAMAEFAAGAGHEINNPVATIAGRIQLLLRDETDPQRRQALLTIGGQARRIRDMIGDTMLFARPPQPEIGTVDVAEAAADVCRSLSAASAGEEADTAELRIELTISEPVQVAADAVQFRIVLQALLENALRADQSGQPVQLVVDAPAEQARIRIVDHGPGFSPREREHAFDPFFSGRQAGRGLGFGLAKCWRIVSNHGGRIEIHSLPSELTTVTVYWPLAG